ncbi:hypothetical protein KIL84_007623 [Mauremys mutica]|uniref:Uncharacterized protein n=1 Tax=Mauremys mutica TaxID=74926 RepID=A0A9D4AX87_9SAUR|nr:hypothetical protein KIL84_007623 [Mauremys mutica]
MTISVKKHWKSAGQKALYIMYDKVIPERENKPELDVQYAEKSQEGYPVFFHLCTTRSGVVDCCKKQQEIPLDQYRLDLTRRDAWRDHTRQGEKRGRDGYTKSVWKPFTAVPEADWDQKNPLKIWLPAWC